MIWELVAFLLEARATNVVK